MKQIKFHQGFRVEPRKDDILLIDDHGRHTDRPLP